MSSPTQNSSSPAGASPTATPPADSDATHAPTGQPGGAVRLALAAEATIVVGLLIGAIGPWRRADGDTVPAIAGLIVLVGVILSGVSFVRLRRYLGPLGPAAGWTQIAFVGVALVTAGVLALEFSDSHAGGFGVIVTALIAAVLLLVGNGIAHLIASVGLARTTRVAGVVGIVANAIALVLGIVTPTAHKSGPVLAALVGALVIAHVAYALGLMKASHRP